MPAAAACSHSSWPRLCTLHPSACRTYIARATGYCSFRCELRSNQPKFRDQFRRLGGCLTTKARRTPPTAAPQLVHAATRPTRSSRAARDMQGGGDPFSSLMPQGTPAAPTHASYGGGFAPPAQQAPAGDGGVMQPPAGGYVGSRGGSSPDDEARRSMLTASANMVRARHALRAGAAWTACVHTGRGCIGAHGAPAAHRFAFSTQQPTLGQVGT